MTVQVMPQLCSTGAISVFKDLQDVCIVSMLCCGMDSLCHGVAAIIPA